MSSVDRIGEPGRRQYGHNADYGRAGGSVKTAPVPTIAVPRAAVPHLR